MSQSARILEFVREFPGRDDDEISRLLDIRPRQTVNQICRALAATGQVVRRPGQSGKISNFPKAGRAPAPRESEPPAGISRAVAKTATGANRPLLTEERLREGGFRRVGEWRLTDDRVSAIGDVPPDPGVYAFVVDAHAQYVGVATTGLAKRLYWYGRPGISQKTNVRVNRLVRDAITSERPVHIYVASPPNFEWNGLSVSGAAGLELGLIRQFRLPWNVRG